MTALSSRIWIAPDTQLKVSSDPSECGIILPFVILRCLDYELGNRITAPWKTNCTSVEAPFVMLNRNDELERIADLLHTRNTIEVEIAKIIGRPAERGHIGEYIAGLIFDIALEGSANHPGVDGFFKSGPLASKSVNIKTYGKRENILDIRPEYLPDYYLVLTGPKTAATSSKGTIRPWVIDEVFLFEAKPLVDELRYNNKKVGTATSVKQFYWERARIYPESFNSPLQLSKTQQDWISLFKGSDYSR